MKILSIGIEGDEGGAMVAKRQIDDRLVERGHSVNDIDLPDPHPALPKASSIARIRRLLGQYDLVHCHSIVGSHSLSAAIAIGFSDTPLVYHTQTSFLADVSWKERHLLRYLLRFQTFLSDAVIFVSELEQELLSPYVSLRPLQAVVENRAGIRDANPDVDLNDFPDVERPYVICVGTVSERKGQHRVVKAMQHLDDLELVLVGSIEMDIHGQIAELGLSDRVYVSGRVEHDAVHVLIANAEALVHASEYESYGIVIAEALAHGIPVVCTDRCGAKHLVTNKNGRIVSINSRTEELVDAVQEVVQLSPGENEFVTDWPGLVDDVEQVYAEVSSTAS